LVTLREHRGLGWRLTLALTALLVLGGCAVPATKEASNRASLVLRAGGDEDVEADSLDSEVLDADAAVVRDARVAAMISAVRQADIYAQMSGLTGVTAITVGGQPFTLKTRNTSYPSYLTKATQYAYEYLKAQGLAVSYHNWDDEDYDVSGRNVVAELRGKTRPGEIVLITAHVDDEPERAVAPGADDNASGSVGVMQAAARLAGRSFARTVRFVLFTGEEIDLLGSWAYAERCKTKNEKIVAVLNLDMIGWDGNGDGIALLRTRLKSDAGYAQDKAIAALFKQMPTVYGISGLAPRILADQLEDGDQASFWYQGYPAIMAIEDDTIEEENPNYHKRADTLATLNMPYMTRYVQAAVGTAAHLAMPVSQ
jgi:hypothetical protein